jgi:hypothetical protein
MKFVANYEIKTECSVVTDDLILRIKHPKGLYNARIQNIPRSVYTTPFLLSLHLYFDAAALDKAKDIANDFLADCLNMLAFTTGARFSRHRMRQIVEVTPNTMKDVLMWSDSIEYNDPEPFIEDTLSHPKIELEKLLIHIDPLRIEPISEVPKP